MRHLVLRAAAILILSLAAAATNTTLGADSTSQPAMVTPAQWLKAQPKPKFQEGHTLPPLTRYGWVLPLDARTELAADWGYALEFGGYATDKSVDKALSDANSDGAKCIALAASDPKRYRLSVICSRDLPERSAVPPETWTRNAKGTLLDGKAQSLDGTVWHEGMKVLYSPEAPDSVWKEAGRLRAEPIARIRAKCPIAIVLNGGEYGLGVLGFAQKAWEQDPAILKAKGNKPWYDYISQRKANAELLIASAVRKAVPDRLLYIYYTTSGGEHRNRYGGATQWMYGYEWMKPVSDLASSEHYYKSFNSGWTGKEDMLTMALNARGFEIANGVPLCYDWLCAGWPRGKNIDPNGTPESMGLGSLVLYTGFLKCLYVAGMVGGNAGYYALPAGGFGKTFPADQPPHWLGQMAAFARVHALFSGLEDYVRNGDLMGGPSKHRWSKDQPAYELPTGVEDVRVVARKHRKKAEWLVAAWAANDKDQEVTVTLDGAGPVKLLARAAGSVFIVKKDGGKAVASLCDPQAMLER